MVRFSLKSIFFILINKRVKYNLKHQQVRQVSFVSSKFILIPNYTDYIDTRWNKIYCSYFKFIVFSTSRKKKIIITIVMIKLFYLDYFPFNIIKSLKNRRVRNYNDNETVQEKETKKVCILLTLLSRLLFILEVKYFYKYE